MANNAKCMLMGSPLKCNPGWNLTQIGASAVGTKESKELGNSVSHASVQYRLGFRRWFKETCKAQLSQELLLGLHSEYWHVSWEILELSYWVDWCEGRWCSTGEGTSGFRVGRVLIQIIRHCSPKSKLLFECKHKKLPVDLPVVHL